MKFGVKWCVKLGRVKLREVRREAVTWAVLDRREVREACVKRNFLDQREAREASREARDVRFSRHR
ncbi:hypothetical protein [Streptomyces sp. NPDC086023]|uniref:hypothetical protein n=1 Tax=Streptomyces sp. NPDC086023 TaxID=3365746 RepID=UPI0037CFDFC1